MHSPRLFLLLVLLVGIQARKRVSSVREYTLKEQLDEQLAS